MASFRQGIILFFLLYFYSLLGVAQIDTAAIYHEARYVSRVKAKKVETLAAALSKNCSTDEETVLAFSYWICKNLKLDYSAVEKRPAENKTIKKILRSRKALSDGYTKLFVELCNTQKIPAIYVPGYTKDYDYMSGDTLYRAEYSWALVKLSDQWYIMDLTAASSVVIAVVSPFARVLWTLFKIPYSSHLMAVREYNPSYLYVDPNRFVEKHVPVSDMFQLRQMPVPISVFMQGDTAVKSYVETYPETINNSPELDYFVGLSIRDKNIMLGDQSELLNPSNQYTRALYYFYALRMFYNNNYISERGKIFASLDDNKQAWNYALMSDSLFAIANKNNVSEQAAKQVRSEGWKRDLIESNKLLSFQLSTQSKVNMQQMRSISKVNSQIKKMKSYMDKYKGKYVLRDIIDLPRPMIQNAEYLEDGTSKINDCYELLDRCKAILIEYDSLMNPLKKVAMDSMYVHQERASSLCNTELLSLSRYLDRKGSNLSLVYYSDKYVFKKNYFDVFGTVGDINDTYTDPTVELMMERVPLVYELIQSYVSNTVQALQLLKSAKVVLANDYGEDDLYEKTALQFNSQLESFASQLKDVESYNTKLSACLADDVDMYKDIVKMLQNDNSMENRRHKEYMEYRKSVRQAENDKIRYFQENIKTYKKAIGKAVNVK